jgi:hypothetical protein
MRTPTKRRVRAGVAGVLACAAAIVSAALAIGAAPAQAGTPGTCATAAHAYLTQPGRAYFAGYDGDQRFGIPTLVVSQGQEIRLGGNGIQPGSGMKFEAFKPPGPGLPAVGEKINFGPLPGNRDYLTLAARGNCVVHEEGPYRVTAPPGKCRIFVTYNPGNDLRLSIFTVVTDVEVLPGLPGINTASAAVSDATAASGEVDLLSPAPSEPDSGGGGGGGDGSDPSPCGNQVCPILQ